MDDDVNYHLPDTSVVDRVPHEGEHCLLVLAAKQDGRERHMAWAVDFNIDYANGDDSDTAAELQPKINEEWTNIMVV